MHAYKPLWIKRGRELLDRLPQHESLVPDMKTDVVVGGFNPFDVMDRYKGILCSIRDQEPFGKWPAFRSTLVQAFEEATELRMRGERRLCGNSFLYMREGS